MATSPDGVHFTPRKDPVMLGNETREYPNNYGIAGGGTILEDVQPDGSIIYRQYYTLAVGGSPGVSVGQRKLCAVAHSRDGIAWGNHSIVMGPTSTAVQPREDTACAAPVVWVDAFTGVYHMVYSAIGTKWGFYSLAQAVSNDGYTWHRGQCREPFLPRICARTTDGLLRPTFEECVCGGGGVVKQSTSDLSMR